MTTIKAYVGYDERNNRKYYINFDIETEVPSAIDDEWETVTVETVNITGEQPHDNVYDYDYYHVVTLNKRVYNEEIESGSDDETARLQAESEEYICVKKKLDSEE